MRCAANALKGQKPTCATLSLLPFQGEFTNILVPRALPCAVSWTAVGMLAARVGLSTAGFFVPPVGEISDSVLWFFAQCLIYAGTALGIDVMIDHKLDKRNREGG